MDAAHHGGESVIAVNGSRMKHVRVSAGSRTDAHGGNSRAELVEAIDELEGEQSALAARKRQIEARLAEIGHRIRGHQLPRKEYLSLTSEQSGLVGELKSLETMFADIHARLKRLRRDLHGFEKHDTHAETNALLRLILRELEVLNGRERAV